MAGDQLGRNDLINGINAVIEKLRSARQPAGIRIVGGAALALRYFDRRTTADIDAQLHPEGPILAALPRSPTRTAGPKTGSIRTPLYSSRASGRSRSGKPYTRAVTSPWKLLLPAPCLR